MQSDGMKDKMRRDKIVLKCVFKEDISLIHVAPTIEYTDLTRKIRKEYGK